MNSFEKKLPDKKCFYNCLKDGITDDNGEILNGHVTNEEYLACAKVWNKFNMKNMGDYRDYYLKKMFCYYLLLLFCD